LFPYEGSRHFRDQQCLHTIARYKDGEPHRGTEEKAQELLADQEAAAPDDSSAGRGLPPDANLKCVVGTEGSVVIKGATIAMVATVAMGTLITRIIFLVTLVALPDSLGIVERVCRLCHFPSPFPEG
jgi:hypothetical protein